MKFSLYVVSNLCSHHFNLHCIPLQEIHNTSINTLVLSSFMVLSIFVKQMLFTEREKQLEVPVTDKIYS